MRLQNGAGGSVVIQHPQLDIFNQQQQTLIQQRLLVLNIPGSGQRARVAQIERFQPGERAPGAPGTHWPPVQQDGIQPRQRFRNQLYLWTFRRRQRRIAVRKFILNKCRQGSKRPLLILAADN